MGSFPITRADRTMSTKPALTSLEDPRRVIVVPLTSREIQLVMAWRQEPFWPDDERVLRKLRAALDEGESPVLSRLQIGIVQGWAEEQVGGRYGGRVTNPDEGAILTKLSLALESD